MNIPTNPKPTSLSVFLCEHKGLCKISGLDEFPEVQVHQKKPATQRSWRVLSAYCVPRAVPLALHTTHHPVLPTATAALRNRHYIAEPRKVMSHIQGHQLINERNQDYTCALNHSTAWLWSAVFASGKLHKREIGNWSLPTSILLPLSKIKVSR